MSLALREFFWGDWPGPEPPPPSGEPRQSPRLLWWRRWQLLAVREDPDPAGVVQR